MDYILVCCLYTFGIHYSYYKGAYINLARTKTFFKSWKTHNTYNCELGKVWAETENWESIETQLS